MDECDSLFTTCACVDGTSLILPASACFVGRPITVSCAYTGRVAVAYRHGGVITAQNNPNNKYINLHVGIYECESTGT